MKSALGPLLCACLLAGASGPVAGASPFDDPFGAAHQTTPNPAQAWGGAPGGPCPVSLPAERPWHLAEVVDLALCHNPQTREAWANARVRAAQLGEAQAGYLPSATLSATLARTQTSSSGGFQIPPQTQFRPLLSLNYLLFDFGSRDATVEAARQSLIAANWTQNATLQNVLFSTVQAYYQLFATQAAVDAARESERASLESLNAATFRHQVGAATLADKLQAQTAYSQARLNRQKAEGDARVAQGVLANLLGLDADRPLRVVPPVWQAPGAGPDDNVRRLIEAAKRARPDLAAAEAQVRAAEANIQAARSSGKPSISLFANYGYNYSSVLNDTRNWSTGLTLNFPLFTGFATTYRVRTARAQLDAQAAGRDRLADQVALDVWRAYQNLNTSRDTWASTEDLLASAIQSEQLALGRYKAGAGNILELLNAQASLANARLQRVQAQYNWQIARAALSQAVGQLDRDSAVPPQAAATP
ncbi:MAG: TolC family protein [Pseudomonadota bacterium]|uniref:TolC family protein n=1 Tax=Thermithiobacillus tepidarius TaxID=929 RepID=UPI0004222830|nr:TolC family protein [Thermithiobacillus tepidarius]